MVLTKPDFDVAIIGGGPAGISLALAAFVGIIASFWVWIAAVMGVWWERKAGPAAVAKMEKLSADVSASSRDLGARRTSCTVSRRFRPSSAARRQWRP